MYIYIVCKCRFINILKDQFCSRKYVFLNGIKYVHTFYDIQTILFESVCHLNNGSFYRVSINFKYITVINLFVYNLIIIYLIHHNQKFQ